MWFEPFAGTSLSVKVNWQFVVYDFVAGTADGADHIGGVTDGKIVPLLNTVYVSRH